MSSSIRLQKPWRALNRAEAEGLPGQLGVYQLGDHEREIAYIGYAGGHSQFGVRGEILRWLEDDEAEMKLFRYEVTMQYMTRYKELLMLYVAEHGSLPCANPPMGSLGRLTVG